MKDREKHSLNRREFHFLRNVGQLPLAWARGHTFIRHNANCSSSALPDADENRGKSVTFGSRGRNGIVAFNLREDRLNNTRTRAILSWHLHFYVFIHVTWTRVYVYVCVYKRVVALVVGILEALPVACRRGSRG